MRASRVVDIHQTANRRCSMCHRAEIVDVITWARRGGRCAQCRSELERAKAAHPSRRPLR